MPTNFVSTLPRMGLYCVWIATGNPRQPLACIWIDPEMRSYGLEDFQQAPTGCVESSQPTKTTEMCREQKRKSSTRLVSFEVSRLSRTNGNRALWVALVLLVLSLLLTPAWADVGGRITGVVTDPSSAFVSGATVALTNANNGTKQTATTNDQGQYSFPVVPVGNYGLEISAPGFQLQKKAGIVIDVRSREPHRLGSGRLPARSRWESTN